MFVMLEDHPGLKGRKQQRSGNASQKPSNHKDIIVIKVLCDARKCVNNAEQDAVLLSAIFISKRANDSPEYHTGPEARNK
mmetsp:Transcript_9524/g.15606  ORF Transcript_9524/g.15606 Transcript_9524/m.15606 type:complete len:80 (-) Transcript_9524:366-605(-)